MAASIVNRATGVVLYGGSLLLALWLLFLAAFPGQFSSLVVPFLHSPVGFIVIAGYVWSLCFHMLAGLRHVYWDSGRGLAYETVKKTSWAIWIGSVVLAAIILAAGYAARGGA